MSSSYKHSHPFSNGSKINKRYLFDTKKTSKDDEESLMMQKTKIKDKYFFFFLSNCMNFMKFQISLHT